MENKGTEKTGNKTTVKSRKSILKPVLVAISMILLVPKGFKDGCNNINEGSLYRIQYSNNLGQEIDTIIHTSLFSDYKINFKKNTITIGGEIITFQEGTSPIIDKLEEISE